MSLNPEDQTIKEDIEIISDKKPAKKTLCYIAVNPGVTWYNLVSIPLITCVCLMLLSYFNAQVIFLLSDPKSYNISPDKIGYVTGVLIFCAQPFGILSAAVAGYIFDIFGRRLTIFLCLAIASVLTAVTPWTEPSFIWLVVLKCVATFFINIPVCNPLCADYISREAIGRGVSINGVGAIMGEVLSMGVLFRITANMNEKMAFGTAGATCLVFSCIIGLMVTEYSPAAALKRQTTDTTSINEESPPAEEEVLTEQEEQDLKEQEEFKALDLCSKVKWLTVEL